MCLRAQRICVCVGVGVYVWVGGCVAGWLAEVVQVCLLLAMHYRCAADAANQPGMMVTPSGLAWRAACLSACLPAWRRPFDYCTVFDCIIGIGMNYSLTERNVLPIYERARQLPNFNVLIYNGDTDPGINSMVTQVSREPAT